MNMSRGINILSLNNEKLGADLQVMSLCEITALLNEFPVLATYLGLFCTLDKTLQVEKLAILKLTD